MTVLASLKRGLASASRRRAAAMTAMTLITMITAVGALPTEAPTDSTAAAIDPTQPVASVESAQAAQTLTVPAGSQPTVQVDSFTSTVPADAAASAPAATEAATEAAPEAAVEPAPAAEPAPAPEPAPEPAPAPPAVQWPVVSTEISDGYGPRTAPCPGCSTFHDGVDFTPGAGTPIVAIADGVVESVSAYDNGGLGVHAIISHVVDGQSLTSTYGHMIEGSLAVSPGQHVSVGQQIGAVGTTGQSTGPHLHLEIYLDGVTPTDPYAWLTEHAGAM